MTKKEQTLTGKDIFNEKEVVLLDGNTYEIKFSMFTLSVMEENLGSVEKVLDLVANPSYSNMYKTIYYSLIAKNKTLRGRKSLEDISDCLEDLVDETNLTQVFILVAKEFERFFVSMEESSNNLAPEYQAILDEMAEKGSKKK